jgi:LacI family transcriptional regulator
MAKYTIRDVARLAGVSVGTVSRVLNNRSGVKPYTKEQVLKVMKTINYHPDIAARELSTSQGLTIGLNIAQGVKRFNPFLFLFYQQLMESARGGGYRFIEIENLPDGMPREGADGMVLFGAHDADPRIDYLKDKKIPFVLVGHGDGIFSVNPDDYNGGYQAGTHLVRLGHTEILHIGGFMHHQAFHDRYNGFRAALSEGGISHNAHSLVIDGEFTTHGAYRAVNRILKTGVMFTAIFASSDEMALGAQLAIEDAGLRMPQDISIVGYDDLPGIGDPYTTIHQNIPLIVQTSLALLLEAFAGNEPRHVTIPVQLVARSSTSRPSTSNPRL